MFGNSLKICARTLFVLQTVLAVAMLVGCSTYRSAEAFHSLGNEPYRLGAGDRIRITVFEQPDLSNAYYVDQSGYISFPLVGAVAAGGYSTQQVKAEITNRLRRDYLRNPDVSVEVESYRPVFVMGEVAATGQYSYVPGLTAHQAIAAAGGFSPRANQASVDITRDVGGKVMTRRVRTSDPLLPGDTVKIRRRLF